MKFLNLKALLLCTAFLISSHVHAATTLRVITTTTDLADIARQVGGDHVNVQSIAKGYQNPHFVDAKPSHIVKLIKADVFIMTGLELEIGWAPLLVQGSRNKKVLPGSPGYIDASSVIEAIEIPTNPSRAMGDVHPGGNPHYMQDPENAIRVAALLAERFSQIEPSLSSAFNSNLEQFKQELNGRIQTWKEKLAPLQGKPTVVYHKSWSYFLNYFGLKSLGEIEPKPGLPPSPAHTAKIIDIIKENKVQLIITDPWYEEKTAQFIARQTGATVLTLALFPEGVPDVKDYFDMMDYNINAILGASVSSQ